MLCSAYNVIAKSFLILRQLNSFQHSSRENGGPKRARDGRRRKILPIHRYVSVPKLPQKETEVPLHSEYFPAADNYQNRLSFFI